MWSQLWTLLLRLPSFLDQSSMESRQQWLTKLKNEFSNSPFVSNVAFGFILMGLEKLVELEFECPCSPKWNGVFSSAFFIIPAVMAFTLMLIIQRCRRDKWLMKTVSSFMPAIVWLILLFLDGQYFACAMTDWEGRFVLVDKAAPQKWCEPVSQGDAAQKALMLRSQQLFVISQVSETLSFLPRSRREERFHPFTVCLYSHTPQVIGIALLISICVGLIVYVIREYCQGEGKTEDAAAVELAMSSQQPRTSWGHSHRPPHLPCWNFVNILKRLSKVAVRTHGFFSGLSWRTDTALFLL